MSNLHKKIELLSNLGIIVVAILLGVVLVNRYLLPSSPKSETVESAQIKPGMKLSLPGVDWGRSSKTLLLVLSTNCHFCTESAPFYQRLAQEKAKHEDISLIAIMPQSVSEAQKYLNDHGISVDQIRQAAPGAAYARGTPTLIMVDKTGSVVESWVGKLPPEKEVEVSNRFLGERSGG
jgi:thiol-disulfide isomerase/thioredoxin